MSDYICPYSCSYRTNSGVCGHTGGCETFQYMQIHQPNTVVGYVPPLQKTNADRIRSMTDEELAHLLHSAEEHLFTGNLWNYDKWTEWLRQSAEKSETI